MPRADLSVTERAEAGARPSGRAAGPRLCWSQSRGGSEPGMGAIFERSQQAQHGQSAGCSGQDLFTSNHESMQLLW